MLKHITIIMPIFLVPGLSMKGVQFFERGQVRPLVKQVSAGPEDFILVNWWTMFTENKR